MLREKRYILYFLYIFSILCITPQTVSRAFVLNVDWRCFINPAVSGIRSSATIGVRIDFVAGEYRLHAQQPNVTTQLIQTLHQQTNDLSACINETVQNTAALLHQYCLESIQNNTEPTTVTAFERFRERYAANIPTPKARLEFCTNAAKPADLALQNRMGLDPQFYNRRYDLRRPRPPIFIGEMMAQTDYTSIPETERQFAINIINSRCRWPQSNEKNLTLSNAIYSANFIRAYLAQARDHISRQCLQNVRRSLLETWQEHLYRDRDNRNENCRFLSETTINTRCSTRAHHALLQIQSLFTNFATPNEQNALRNHCNSLPSTSRPINSSDILALNRVLNRREDCQPLTIGESLVVDDDGEVQVASSHLPRRYVLERLTDRHQLTIRLQLQHNDAMVRARMQQHIRSCLPEINQVLGHTPTTDGRLQLQIQLEPDRTPPAPLNYIRITAPGTRPDAGNWPQDISCEAILHETLHLAGLVDLYLETETARPINIDTLSSLIADASNDQHMTSGRRVRRDSNRLGGDFTLLAEIIGASRAYDCRHLGSSNSIMAGGDIYQRVLAASNRGDTPQVGILEPGELRLLIQPFCGSANRNYLDCASSAYTSSDEAGNCPQIPNPVCQSRIETLIRQEKTDGSNSGHRQNQRLTTWLQ